MQPAWHARQAGCMLYTDRRNEEAAMATVLSPTLQKLLREHADAFLADVESAIIDMDALTFYRYAADRQLEYAREFARAARLERMSVCGRCGQGSVTVVKVGPYTVCEPCAATISS
jgi:hypothetical protein